MDKSRFFKILKNIQVYGYEKAYPDLDKETEGVVYLKNEQEEATIAIDLQRFQVDISAEANNTDYRFLVFNFNGLGLRRYAVLSAYLQGALLKSKGGVTELDESFTNYQKNNLKLLFGSFAFIDKGNNKLHYLLGSSRNSLKQSFQFKSYYNIENRRGQQELLEMPSSIMKLLFEVNQTSRDKTQFVNNLDFYRIFNDPRYIEKRNGVIETRRNIVYVSSGEIDHCILQWIFLHRKNRQSVEHENEKFGFDFNMIYKRYEKLFFENGLSMPFPDRGDEDLANWLKEWGLISATRGKPTKRLMASLEWFYFYLLKVVNDPEVNYYDYTKYLDYIPDDDGLAEPYITLDKTNEKYIRHYISVFEGIFPYLDVHRQDAVFSRNPVEDAHYIQNFPHLINAYYDLLLRLDEDPDKFKKRCRFNPAIHFLYRNCISEFYWGDTDKNLGLKQEHRDLYRYKEKTCRGILFIPILNNPEIGERSPHDTGKNNAGQVGYFIGHIKDSDHKGRNYFTHYKKQDGTLDDAINNFFEDEFYELNHVINTLGRIEREEVYLKGILKKQVETEKEKFALLRKTSHSLTTHSFKTELKTTILPQLTYVKRKKDTIDFDTGFEELERMCNGLFNLTGVISLVDKLEDPVAFIDSGENDRLLSRDKCEIDFEKSMSMYNSLNRAMHPITRDGSKKPLPPFSMKIFDRYFTSDILNLFCHTIFENLKSHGRHSNKTIPVTITYDDETWEFTNSIREDKSFPDVKKLRGNLYLFQTLLEKSRSGALEIDSDHHQFRLQLNLFKNDNY